MVTEWKLFLLVSKVILLPKIKAYKYPSLVDVAFKLQNIIHVINMSIEVQYLINCLLIAPHKVYETGHWKTYLPVMTFVEKTFLFDDMLNMVVFFVKQRFSPQKSPTLLYQLLLDPDWKLCHWSAKY